MSTPPDHPHVVAALAAVMAELGGIGKLTAAERRQRGLTGGDERGVTYAYRGIDQIAAAAQPLLGRHGVVTVPVVEESRVDQLVINERPWTDTWVRVRWLIYGPGGVDDRLEAVTEGLGRDNSDKGPNKAITGAYKNLLLRLLCIGDPADDTDGHTHEADTARPDPAVLEAFNALTALSPGAQAKLRKLADEHDRKLSQTALAADPAWLRVVRGVIDADRAATARTDTTTPISSQTESAPTTTETTTEGP